MKYLLMIFRPPDVRGTSDNGSELATTVRVEDGRTLTTDGPCTDIEEGPDGFYVLDAADLDGAIEVAARIPPARLGGAVEIRPVAER